MSGAAREARAPVVLAVLLAGAAAIAVLRTVSESRTIRAGAAVSAIALSACAWGSLRRRAWGLGAAFFLGLFTLWATVALGLQHRLTASGTAAGIGWSIAVMVASVRSRASERGAPDGTHLHKEG